MGYLALNELTYRIATAGNVNDLANTMRYSEQDKYLGFEADLGFSFQLLDDLQLVTSFAYMFNGDAYTLCAVIASTMLPPAMSRRPG